MAGSRIVLTNSSLTVDGVDLSRSVVGYTLTRTQTGGVTLQVTMVPDEIDVDVNAVVETT